MVLPREDGGNGFNEETETRGATGPLVDALGQPSCVFVCLRFFVCEPVTSVPSPRRSQPNGDKGSLSVLSVVLLHQSRLAEDEVVHHDSIVAFLVVRARLGIPAENLDPRDARVVEEDAEERQALVAR